MSDPPTLDNPILRRLVATAMQPPQPALWDAPEPGLLQAAAASYLLLDHNPPYDAEHFILNTLEPLLHEASRNTARRLVQDTKAVRGRVLWGQTVAARAAAGQGEQPYVYQELRRRYDTPENRLLRLLIEQLAAAVPLIPAVLRSGGSYVPARTAGDWLAAAPRLRRMEDVLLRARHSPRLRHVPLPERVEATMILRAETARNEGYALTARLYRRYSALRSPNNWRNALAAVGRRALPLPAALDPAAEPWIELAALNLIRVTR